MDGVYGFRSGVNQAVPDGFQVSLYVRQGSPQLMGNIRGQIAVLAFRFLQSLGHDVEAVCQFPYLGGSGGLCPLREVAAAQPPGRGAQAL